MEAGKRAVVNRIPGTDDALVSYLAERGLVPGATVTIVEVAPFDGPVMLTVGATPIALNRDMSEAILVDPLT